MSVQELGRVFLLSGMPLFRVVGIESIQNIFAGVGILPISYVTHSSLHLPFAVCCAQHEWFEQSNGINCCHRRRYARYLSKFCCYSPNPQCSHDVQSIDSTNWASISSNHFSIAAICLHLELFWFTAAEI